MMKRTSNDPHASAEEHSNEARSKKLYQDPKLSVYGDLRRLTAGANMSLKEGGGQGGNTHI